jgi:hypothetical protein
MKKQTFILSFLFACRIAQAQLDPSHFAPSNPKRAISLQVEPPLNLSGGQNQNWDFSNLNPNGEEFNIQFTHINHPRFSAFPGAQIALKAVDDTSESYLVFEKKSNGVFQRGIYASVNGETSQQIFSDPKLFYPQGFSFGQGGQDGYKAEINMSQPGFLFRVITTGQIEMEVDGSGTLTLPDGSNHAGVIRITTKDRFSDSTYLELPGFPSEPDVSIGRNTLYQWFKNDGSGNPILFSMSIDSVFSEGNWEVNVHAFYVSNGITSIQPVDQEYSPLPYPSKVENILFIPTKALGQGMGKIQIADPLGRLVFTKEVEPQNLVQDSLEIDLTQLKPGLYHIILPGKMGEKKKPISIIKL